MNSHLEVGWASADKVPRRAFLVGSAAAAIAVGGAGAVAVAMASRTKAHADRDLRSVCMAMHVHASASEGPGSMEAQLAQATKSGVDVLWWTEHDFRMSAHDAVTEIRCSGMAENGATAPLWQWTSTSVNATKESKPVFATAANEALLGSHPSAVFIDVTARSARLARHVLSGQSGNLLNRTSLAGQRVDVDVYPTDIGLAAFLSVELTTSYRPDRTGVPAGDYVVEYRVGGAQLPGVTVLQGPDRAVVTMAAPVGRWTTLSLAPESDIARVWPGVNGADASVFNFAVVAGARGKNRKAGGYFTNIRFGRDASGQRPLATQRDLMSYYADKFPTVKQLQALEVSLTTPHLGWYGGTITLPEYSGAGPYPSQDEAVAAQAVHTIHAMGGIASYCHPFGTSTAVLSQPKQEAARVAKSGELVGNRALNCELLEVGYRMRGGCDLDKHESLWDNCSRNNIFLTGVGVNDNHKGQEWLDELLNFVTWAWAPDTKMTSLLSALRAGRVYFGDLARFQGQLDLRLDGEIAMGSVSVSTATKRELSILASGLPSGSTVEMRRGVVDHAGPSDTTPKITVESIRATRFGSSEELSVPVDTSESCFVRVVVKDDQGLPIAFSNPTWLLRSAPSGGIPTDRRVLS